MGGSKLNPFLLRVIMVGRISSSLCLGLSLCWIWACGESSDPGVSPETEPQLLVTTLGDETTDDTTCSLREAIVTLNQRSAVGGCGEASAQITLAPDLAGGLLQLNAPLPPILANVLIQGSEVTISGAGGFRLLEIPAESQVILQQLRLTNGVADQGGAIWNQGQLRLNSVTLMNNQATTLGGGIANLNGRLILEESTLMNNSAGDQGGGIYSLGGQIFISSSTFSGNQASDLGGGIQFEGARLNLENSRFSNNQAPRGAGLGITTGQVLINSVTFRENAADNILNLSGEIRGEGNDPATCDVLLVNDRC